MLTRKDFIKKADEIIEVGKRRNWKEKIDIEFLPIKINDWCKYFKKSNKRFDEQRFREYIEVGIYGNKI